VITRPGRQKPSYISAINHNEFVALVGEAESVVGEIIQPHYVWWFSCWCVSQRDQIIHRREQQKQ